MVRSMEKDVVANLFFHDPHNFLGLHAFDEKNKVIRLWRPGAPSCHFELFGEMIEAKKIDPRGLFEAIAPKKTTALDYRVYHPNHLLAHDPYAFLPTLGEVDLHLFSHGVHYKIYEILGAHLINHFGVTGTKFAVWAPNAKKVSLVADFNQWDGNYLPMRSLGASGIWEIFVPGACEGEKYKFEIFTQNGERKIKSDPYAHFNEYRPKTASIVFDVNKFHWTDTKWMEKRAPFQKGKTALSIYEVHLGSWQKDEKGQFLNYRELALRLALYCHEMGFTHVELMPVMEHPFDDSWGYQVTGYFAVTSRFGTPEDFQFFVNHLHENGIGVIMDWVPAHFPTDDYSLSQFDGTHLYEHADPKKGFHPHWATLIFNYGRLEVVNFLIASALFWLEKMHIDGLRVDAVASMIYLDYGRQNGEWIPNTYGGNINLEAIEFIKHFNSIVHEKFPSAMTFAEESTAYEGVTRPLQWGGLGFDFKWNMGWMNDTLRYFATDPLFRHYHQQLLTFVMVYAFSERFVLVLSHDEVVHGKASLLAKMPGDPWQKFANMRLLYGYLICQPGKKLLFMGGEFGIWDEWNAADSLPWHLSQYDEHAKLKRCIKELNHFYLKNPALWEWDFEPRSFEWIDFSDSKNSVISYLRKSDKQIFICIHNFTPTYFEKYKIFLQHIVHLKERFNTDREEYGGSGKINEQVEIEASGFQLKLAPLATLIFEVEFDHS
ncbi:MAG TPA: 1,4-alpha-glucan branching protein GlgB [Rhabdochlamydiaceae bacterium]|nr:1,4-alpha-glucan branching protein GlgB [Rhabdochlamydiaceae bacterium]